MTKEEELKHLRDSDLFPNELIKQYEDDYDLIAEELAQEAEELRVKNVSLAKKVLDFKLNEEMILNCLYTRVNTRLI